MTTVQGDGLIISTPTGSTAYAMAAGASMCHPSVQSLIIAPICPHSLSFRPIVVPAGVELKIALNDDARNPSAWFSVDGRNTAELKQGFHISITASEYPLPSICRSDQVCYNQQIYWLFIKNVERTHFEFFKSFECSKISN